MSGSWRVLGTEEGLRGRPLRALAEGTQGRGTGDPGGYGAPYDHEIQGGQQGYPALHTCGKGSRETDGDG